jgi:hypothetical protein
MKMMSKKKPTKTALRIAAREAEQLARCTSFVVYRYGGFGGAVVKEECLTLSKALTRAKEIGRDQWGRPCIIYGITPEGTSVPYSEKETN